MVEYHVSQICLYDDKKIIKRIIYNLLTDNY